MLEIADQISIINKHLWKQVIFCMGKVLLELEINRKSAMKIFKLRMIVK